jgi:hypothetical protein
LLEGHHGERAAACDEYFFRSRYGRHQPDGGSKEKGWPSKRLAEMNGCWRRFGVERLGLE